jgi:uncharacterized repeat protein (TIGR03803 family)
MKLRGRISSILPIAMVAFAVALNTVSAGAAENTILRFSGRDGERTQSGLISDGKGNLYGTTPEGGNNGCQDGCGVVFELSPAANGAWTETVIYAFKGGTTDTSVPTTDLIFDAQGNLFGGSNGAPAIYELTPGAGNTWSEKVVYSFTQYYQPGNHLAFDSKGNLYGTLFEGGDGGVFQLIPQSSGSWTGGVIYAFTGTNGDGNRPFGGVGLDGEGDVYGTTQEGGSSNEGTVYKLTPKGSGFTESIIYNFTGYPAGTGSYPIAPLMIDASGNLYGATPSGSTQGTAMVFKLSESAGKWTETVLYIFGSSPDGAYPNGVVFDAKGNLYGTANGGGSGCNYPGCGIVYKLTPSGSGPWRETILHNFESWIDGSGPGASVYVDGSTGVLYSTTIVGGGRYGYGTVFQIVP